MRKDIVKLKAGLLCCGARVERETAKLLEAEYPHFFDNGFIHAVSIRLYDANVNVIVAEEFSGDSPYLIIKRDGCYRVTGEGWDEPVFFYLRHTGAQVPLLLAEAGDGETGGPRGVERRPAHPDGEGAAGV